MTPFPRGAGHYAVDCWSVLSATFPHIVSGQGPRWREVLPPYISPPGPAALPATGGSRCRRRNARGAGEGEGAPGRRRRRSRRPFQRSTDSLDRGSQGGLKKKQEASWRTDGWLKSLLPLSSLCSLWGCGAGQGERVRERGCERCVLIPF